MVYEMSLGAQNKKTAGRKTMKLLGIQLKRLTFTDVWTIGLLGMVVLFLLLVIVDNLSPQTYTSYTLASMGGALMSVQGVVFGRSIKQSLTVITASLIGAIIGYFGSIVLQTLI